jgi:hypothetical protein
MLGRLIPGRLTATLGLTAALLLAGGTAAFIGSAAPAQAAAQATASAQAKASAQLYCGTWGDGWTSPYWTPDTIWIKQDTGCQDFNLTHNGSAGDYFLGMYYVGGYGWVAATEGYMYVSAGWYGDDVLISDVAPGTPMYIKTYWYYNFVYVNY